MESNLPPTPEPTPTVTPNNPTGPDLSFKAIIECKEGSMKVMEKVVSIGPSLDQLKIVHDYQTKCLQTLGAAKIKISAEPVDSANEALLFALEKTSNRLILDNQIIKKLSDSFASNNGVALTEDVLGFLFASKMMYQQENDGWGKYKTALEQKNLQPKTQP